MKFIIVGGGTGGHVFPALALAEQLKNNGHEVLFIGNENSMESKIVAKHEIPFQKIKVQKLYRRITYKHFFFVSKLISSTLRVCRIIKKFKPDAVIGTGGFVSGPVYLASYLKNITLYLQEQNSYPGITNRFAGSFAKLCFLGMPGAQQYFEDDKTIFSGNPIQKNELVYDKSELYEKYDLDKTQKTVMIYCGSQGSGIVNSAIEELLENLISAQWNILWQTGKKEFSQYKKYKQKNVHVFDFTYEKYEIMELADFAISRAGALTIAELESNHIPSIFIPYPYAAENHQMKNAKDAEKRGLGIVLPQSELHAKHLLSFIVQLSSFKISKTHFCKHDNAVKTITQIMIEDLEK